MKKLFILLTAALICAALLVPASAVRDWVEPVGDVYVPFVTTPPTLDGVISDGEWNENATFIINDWNMMSVYTQGYMELPEDWETKVNVAWDYDYLYIATQCKDVTTTGRPYPYISGVEGDYFRFNLDFGDAPDQMFSGVSAAWCLVDDTESNNDFSTILMYLVNNQPNGDWVEGSWGITAVKNEYWIFEGRIPWEIISAVYEFNCDVKVTPEVGMTATGCIWYCDFDNDYNYTNWFGTSMTGYDAVPWFGPSGFGITYNFVGSDADVKPRPETTEPGQTVPEDTSGVPASSAVETSLVPTQSDTGDKPQTDAPTTTEAAPKDDGKSGLPTGAIIGIAAGAAVIVAGAIAIFIPKKKKS
ncbi:MAG: hypothetical protein J5563_00530 [Clostridia bacterium]|nr:hypothetical protein [Clostridia bacterium]